MEKIFKVIKIIDDTSLIVNAGKNDKVEIGDIMKIQGKSEKIFDPETNEYLGELDITKDELRVSEIYDKMCVCETSYISNYVSSLMKANPLFSSTQRKMDVNPADISGAGDKSIRVGDIAILQKNKSNSENKSNKNE